MNIKKYNFSRGFTLVELLVVIAIIGILAATILAQIGSARAKARDARRIQDLNQILTAIELYNNDKGEYPPTPNNLAILETEKYISKLPVDPKNGTSPFGYKYGVDTSKSKFQISAELELYSSALGTDADIKDTTIIGGQDGTLEPVPPSVTCSADQTVLDCVFDLGQK